MRLRSKLLKDVTAEDIIYLKNNQIQESINLEYKKELPGNSDSDKKEFLADVSSFANTIGGTIIYGIEEEKDEHGRNRGIPKEIVGLGTVNFDQEKQRLENIIRDNLDPKLTNLLIRNVEVDKSKQ